MSKIDYLRHEMEKKGYHITERISASGEVSIREGRGGHIIMEIENVDRDKIKTLLNDLQCRTMIRVKDDGNIQYIIKMSSV
ncbi:hypothetical protein [uncultured Ilyobacter sp.]|jgi:hypothetical protein|uniref:hypothetical protein n=1 Tax=uncultured Ilyobacter sp. TaxID=544433 RepID=UPI0029BFB3CB|nr:hypothetical protein [uncultured Ilyobacter sp.]